MIRSCLRKFPCVRAIVLPQKYHHYNEERMVSPNNYYSKELSSESVSSQCSYDISCPNTNDIQFIKEQLADIQRMQASQTTAITELQQRPSLGRNINNVEKSVSRLGLRFTAATLITWSLHLFL